MKNTVAEETNSISTTSKINVRQARTTLFQCRICGAPARYSYYGAVVCQSCKVFFKRNAETKQAILQCHFNNQCEINMNNRHNCASCRLKKCFAVKMCIGMIRAPRSKKNTRNKKKTTINDSTSSVSVALVALHNENQPRQLPTLNLLRSDQSTLNIEQCNLLSNLVHCFDEYVGYSYVQSYIQQQNTLPIKLRYKYSSVKGFFTSIKIKIQLAFEKNHHLQLFSSHDRSTLLRTAAEYTASVRGMFILRQHHLFNYASFYNSAEMIFRPSAAAFTRRVVDQLDSDDTFIKLILASLSFSTINYTVSTKFDQNNLINVKAILSIQDMYTELAWRYLLYKYGHDQSVKRFSTLIRCLLHVNNAVAEAHESKQFTKMIDTIIEQTEQILCL